jgi:two-component system, response regulator
MEQVETMTILYIEDDPAHAEFTMRYFNKSNIGKRIIHLSDGQQALDYLFNRGEYSDEEKAPRPNLILLDLRLPKVDGLEVLKIIKSDEFLRRIPTVILTTSEAEADISKAYHYYANSYLVKPLDFVKFSNMIESLGLYWVMWNKYSEQNE